MFGYCSSMGLGGWLVMIGLWVAFLAVVAWGVSRLFPSGSRRRPEDVLDERLAAGEIDVETYRQARDELRTVVPSVAERVR